MIKMVEKTPNKPVRVFQYALCKLSEWDNVNTEGKKYKTYTLERSYKDNEDAWKKQSMSMNGKEVGFMVKIFARFNNADVKITYPQTEVKQTEVITEKVE